MTEYNVLTQSERAQKKGEDYFDRYITDEATTLFSRLDEPDTKYDDDGVYTIMFALDGSNPSVQSLIQDIDAAVEEKLERTKGELKAADRKKLSTHHPYEEELDEETEEPTGRFIFKTKTKASGKKKSGETWHKKVPLFDAKGKPTKSIPMGGSTVKVSMNPKQYYAGGQKTCGLTFYLNAIQVIELSGGGGSASSFGFGEEDGFEDDGSADDAGNDDASEDDDDNRKDF